MHAVSYQSRYEEQRGNRDAVIDLMDGAAGQPVGRQSERAQQHQAEVAEAGVPEHASPAGLRKRGYRGQDDADRRDGHERGGEGARCLRQQRKTQPEKSIGPHLQEYRGEKHGHGRRPSICSNGYPPAKYAKEASAKPHGEGDEYPSLHREREREVLEHAKVECLRSRKRPPLDVQHEHPGQNHEARRQCHGGQADKGPPPAMIDCRRRRSLAGPADEQAHRRGSQHPAQTKEQEIERHVDAEHPRFERENGDVERLEPHRDPRPWREDGDEGQECRQENQDHAQTVDADRVARADRRQQVEALGELPLGAARLEAEGEARRGGTDEGRRDPRDGAQQAVTIASDTGEQERASKGDESDDGKEMPCHAGSILF